MSECVACGEIYQGYDHHCINRSAQNKNARMNSDCNTVPGNSYSQRLSDGMYIMEMEPSKRQSHESTAAKRLNRQSYMSLRELKELRAKGLRAVE